MKDNNISKVSIGSLVNKILSWKHPTLLRFLYNLISNIGLLILAWWIIIPSEHVELFTLTFLSCLSDLIGWSCVSVIFLHFNKSNLFKTFRQNNILRDAIMNFLGIFFLIQLSLMVLFTYLFTVDISNNNQIVPGIWIFIVLFAIRAILRFNLLFSSNKKIKNNVPILSSILLWGDLSFFIHEIKLKKENELVVFRTDLKNIGPKTSYLDELNSLNLANIIGLIIDLGLLISKATTSDVSILVWLCYEIVIINSVLLWFLMAFNMKTWFVKPQEFLNKILANKDIILNFNNLNTKNSPGKISIEQLVILLLNLFETYFNKEEKIPDYFELDTEKFFYISHKVLTTFLKEKTKKFSENKLSHLKLIVINEEKQITLKLDGKLNSIPYKFKL